MGSIQHSLARAISYRSTYPTQALPTEAHTQAPTQALPAEAPQIEIYTQREELGSTISSQSPLATTPARSLTVGLAAHLEVSHVGGQELVAVVNLTLTTARAGRNA